MKRCYRASLQYSQDKEEWRIRVKCTHSKEGHILHFFLGPLNWIKQFLSNCIKQFLSYCIVFTRKADCGLTIVLPLLNSYPPKKFVSCPELYTFCSFILLFLRFLSFVTSEVSPVGRKVNRDLPVWEQYCSKLYPHAVTEPSCSFLLFVQGQQRYSLCKHNLTVLLKFYVFLPERGYKQRQSKDREEMQK